MNSVSPIQIDTVVTLATSAHRLAGSRPADTNPGVAAQDAEQDKHSSYAPHKVTPFALEVHGRFGECAQRFLQDVSLNLPPTE